MAAPGSISVSHVWKRFREPPPPGTSKWKARLRRRHDWRYALRDVNLEVPPGDSVGLVGLNGSGKSTLLKVLSGSMFPYAGKVTVTGRIGALIEVRAGIHPDLSGRENVMINGSMLGLSRRAIADRFDQIVEFAELEDAIDRQVKHYSSGMQMRLGFSIAAFLEPEVLFVDEALAVGDLPFQQRCLDRMTTVLSQGTTLIFVSHDLTAVQAMCKRAMWLDGGVPQAEGDCATVVGAYRQGLEAKVAKISGRLNDPVRLESASINGFAGRPLTTGEPAVVELRIAAQEKLDVRLAIGVSEGPATPIFVIMEWLHLPAGESSVRCVIDSLPLPKGRFYLWAGAYDGDGRLKMTWHPVQPADVVGPDRVQLPTGVQLLSPIHVAAAWSSDAADIGAAGQIR